MTEVSEEDLVALHQQLMLAEHNVTVTQRYFGRRGEMKRRPLMENARRETQRQGQRHRHKRNREKHKTQ